MKRFIALVLSLVMALSLCAPAWGMQQTGDGASLTPEITLEGDGSETNPYVVSTFDDLQTAVANGGYIKLGADIGVSGDLDSTQTIRVSNEVNLDLNGYILYGPHISAGSHYYAFIVETGGTLTLTDTSAAQTGEIKCHYSGIETKGGTFVMNGGKITAADALYAVAVVNYGGTVTINDGVVNAYDTAITTQAYFADTATTKVAGGEVNLLSSDNNYAVFEIGGVYNNGSASVEIAGGDVNSNGAYFAGYDTTTGTATMEVTGGTFDTDVSDYIAEGYKAFEKTDGSFFVDKYCTVSFAANEGTGTMETQTIAVNSDYPLPRCTFTPPEGKQFKAWSVDGVEYAEGKVIRVTTDVEVTAVWKDAEECTGASHLKIVVNYSGDKATKVYCDYCGLSFAFIQGTEADAEVKFGAGNYKNAENDVWYVLNTGVVPVPVPPADDVDVDFSVDGDTVTVDTVNLDKITSEEVEADSVTLDFSAEGDVSTVVIPTQVVNDVKDVVASTAVNNLEIVTADATVTFDAAAVNKIGENVGDNASVSLTVDVEHLPTATDISEENQEAFAEVMEKDGSENAVLLSIELVDENGTELFAEGKSAGTVVVTVKLAEGMKSATLYYLNGSEIVELGSYNADAAGYITVTLKHFSEYVLLGSTETIPTYNGGYPIVGGTTTEPDVTSPDTFDAGVALYAAVSVMGAMGAVVLGKKRED